MMLQKTIISNYNTILNSDSPADLANALAQTYDVLNKSNYYNHDLELKQISIIRHVSIISSYIHNKIENTLTDKNKIEFETTYAGLISHLKYQ